MVCILYRIKNESECVNLKFILKVEKYLGLGLCNVINGGLMNICVIFVIVVCMNLVFIFDFVVVINVLCFGFCIDIEF